MLCDMYLAWYLTYSRCANGIISATRLRWV
jgi:hypothetical protein